MYMQHNYTVFYFYFFFQAEDGIRDHCVTGVQTCALPIYLRLSPEGGEPGGLRAHARPRDEDRRRGARGQTARDDLRPRRSEERRVGKECRSRWSPDHQKKKEEKQTSSITDNSFDRNAARD